MFTSKPLLCASCARPNHTAFSCPYKRRAVLKAKRPMRQRGKRTIEYERWRDTVAKPYLDKKFGHVCVTEGCFETEGLEVDHIRNRSTHPHLKMDLGNVQWLCNPHHQNKTYGFKPGGAVISNREISK